MEQQKAGMGRGRRHGVQQRHGVQRRQSMQQRPAEGSVPRDVRDRGRSRAENTDFDGLESPPRALADKQAKAAAEEEAKEDQANEEDGKMGEETATEAPEELMEKEQLRWRVDSADMGEAAPAKFFDSLPLPSREAGSDEGPFDWQGEVACSALLKSWVQERRRTRRADGLQSGAWFKEEVVEWHWLLGERRREQAGFKDPARRKRALLDKKAEASEEGCEEERAVAGEMQGAAAEAADKKLMEIDVADLDAYAVKDVVGSDIAEPLFDRFVYEDWALLSMRLQLHLSIHSLEKDLNDLDRPSFREGHPGFFCLKRFQKPWVLKVVGSDGQWQLRLGGPEDAEQAEGVAGRLAWPGGAAEVNEEKEDQQPSKAQERPSQPKGADWRQQSEEAEGEDIDEKLKDPGVVRCKAGNACKVQLPRPKPCETLPPPTPPSQGQEAVEEQAMGQRAAKETVGVGSA